MKLFFKIMLIVSALNIKAQQCVMFSHYFYKPMVYNPAYAGTGGATSAMLINHTQWMGFKGGPQYNILTVDGNLINKNTGLGISLISDKKGITSRIGGNIFYSYKLKFNSTSHLLLGVSAGAIDQTINLSNATFENPNDPYLFSNSQRKTTFDANAGLALVVNNFEFGFAIPQIANNKLNYLSNTDARTYYTQARHYMSTLKYKFMISKAKDISVTPLGLVRYVPNTPFQYDANLNFDFKNKFWIGATYKSNYAVGANAGVTLFNRLSIGYNYDFITASVGKYAGLSHEIMLNFKFIKSEKRKLREQEKKDQEMLKSVTGKDLNKLIIMRLLERIERVLDSDKSDPEEINQILEEISAFLDSDAAENDPLQITLNQYYKSLKQPQGELSVLVKGKIVFEGNENATDYSGIDITITDIGTKQVVAICKPSPKNGNYFIILKPGKKYVLLVQKEGFPNHTRNFSPDGSVESYEMSQEIRLKK